MKSMILKLLSFWLVALLAFSFVAATADAASGRPVLKKEMRGDAVKKLQTDLKKLGFFNLNPTGYFGDATLTAVKNFQKKYGIPATGVVASLTYGKIDSLLKRQAAAKSAANGAAGTSSAGKAVQPQNSGKSAQVQSPGNTVREQDKSSSSQAQSAGSRNQAGSDSVDGLKAGVSGPEVLKLQNGLHLLGYFNAAPTGNFGPITESALIQFQKYYGLSPSGIADSVTLTVIGRLLSQTDSISRGDVDRMTPKPLNPLYSVIVEWIPGLPQVPYLKGIGKYEGVVIHYTENPNDSARMEADYEKKHWYDAFVHEFIDSKEIIQVANPDYKAWGAGKYANDRFIHLELCTSGNRKDFDISFDKITQRAAEYLYMLRLGVTPAKADGTGTLWSHYDVSRYLGGTDHRDPISYLAKWGKTWDDVISAVTEKYGALSARRDNADGNNAAAGGAADNSAADNYIDGDKAAGKPDKNAAGGSTAAGTTGNTTAGDSSSDNGTGDNPAGSTPAGSEAGGNASEGSSAANITGDSFSETP